MNLKNFNFNQKPKLLINGVEYIASNIIDGTFHIYNKSEITLNDVWYKDERSRVSHSLKFPPFSLVEIYFGNDLAFFGVNKVQNGGSLDPFGRKDLRITVVDFKEWLTHKPMDFVVYNKDPEWIVNKIASSLNEKRIIIGDLKFGKTDKVKAYSARTKNAYDMLRMVEKKTQSILQITPNSNGQLVINFYTKDSVKINKTGTELNLADETKAQKFYEDNQIVMFNWKEDLNKFANMVRVQSEKALGETSINISFNLNGNLDAMNLLKPVGKIEKGNIRLYEADGTTLVRKLVVITKDQAEKGKLYDLAYEQGSSEVLIGTRLIGKNQVVKFEYYPVVKLEYQMDNVASQKQIANYSGSNGILFRTEKHNDETSPSDLIALGKGYLAKNSEPRVSLSISSTKPVWDLGEHTKLTTYVEPSINGDYVVYMMTIRQVLTNAGAILTRFTYHLMNSLDYDEALNVNDPQDYRANPVFETSDVIFDTRLDIQENLTIEVKNFTCGEKVVNEINGFEGEFSNIDQELNFVQYSKTELGTEFSTEAHVTSMTMPGIQTVGISALWNATGLKRLILPNATRVNASACSNCFLTYLDIRKVTSIMGSPFLRIVNAPTTEVFMNKKYDVSYTKDAIFGNGSYGYGGWNQITFHWYNDLGLEVK